jgi:hypothetical protein
MRSAIYRLATPLAVLLCFLSMSWLYGWGDHALYEDILRWCGIVPFRFPFVDISFSLAAWECTRQGVDVILSNPCDILHRGYSYSPLWMTASPIPLGVGDTMTVGWCLDLLFIASLTLLPPPRRPVELGFVLAATLSTMVVFALERANLDILMFMLVLAAGLLAECRASMRPIGYGFALLAALLKYYPIMALITVFRERPPRFFAITIALTGVLAVFWVIYHVGIAEGFPTIPRGPYNTDLFAAQNLPFLLGEGARNVAWPSSWAPLVGQAFAAAIYATMIGVCWVVCRRLLSFGQLGAALASLSGLERTLLVTGCAVIVGCFFAGQSVAYRGVFLLMVIPGLLGIARPPASRNLRAVGTGASLVIVLLMWGECFRLALYRGFELHDVPATIAAQLGFYFWLIRELGWWWTVAVMLGVLAEFLRVSPVLRRASSRLDRSVETV